MVAAREGSCWQLLAQKPWPLFLNPKPSLLLKGDHRMATRLRNDLVNDLQIPKTTREHTWRFKVLDSRFRVFKVVRTHQRGHDVARSTSYYCTRYYWVTQNYTLNPKP